VESKRKYVSRGNCDGENDIEVTEEREIGKKLYEHCV